MRTSNKAISKTIYISIGSPGSKKGEYMENLAKTKKGLFLSSEELKKDFESSQSKGDSWNFILDKLSSELAQGNPLVYFEATNFKKSKRKILIKLAKQFGYRIGCYYFDYSLDSCLANNLSKKDLPYHVLTSIYFNLDKPTKKEGFFEINRISAEHIEDHRVKNSIMDSIKVFIKNKNLPKDLKYLHLKKVDFEKIAKISSPELRLAFFLRNIGKTFTEYGLKNKGSILGYESIGEKVFEKWIEPYLNRSRVTINKDEIKFLIRNQNERNLTGKFKDRLLNSKDKENYIKDLIEFIKIDHPDFNSNNFQGISIK